MELAHFEVAFVDVGDFELAAGRWADVGGDVADLLVVKVQAGHRIVGRRVPGLFLDADGTLLRIELDHAVALGVVHMVGEHAGTRGARIGAGQ